MTIESIFRAAPLLLDSNLKKTLELYFECMVEDRLSAVKESEDVSPPDASSEPDNSESDDGSDSVDSELMSDDDSDDESDIADEKELTLIMEKIAPLAPTAMLTSLCDMKKFKDSWVSVVFAFVFHAVVIYSDVISFTSNFRRRISLIC